MSTIKSLAHRERVIRDYSIVGMKRTACFLLLSVILLTQTVVAKEKISGFDIVTMRNGDIHQGTVAEEFITIETSIGILTVPYYLLEVLSLGKNLSPDSLTTKYGEKLIGNIRNKDITMLRVLDTTLPLDLDGIANIRFSYRGIATRKMSDSAILEVSDGSRILASITTRDLLLKEPASLQILKRDEIHSIDLGMGHDESMQAQVKFRNGKVSVGILLTDQLSVKTHYSNNAIISISKVSSLVYSPLRLDGKTDFYHRWDEVPESLIQDYTVGGEPATELIAIMGEEFTRGDVSGDTDERPPIKISLDAFAIGVFEVTFDEYDKFCVETRKDCPDDEGWGRGRRPVINVSWNDANAYIQWLSRKTGKTYRLPTDAEWEYAARGRSKTTYWWGNETGLANANCEGCGSPWDGEKTALVGRFPANPLGLHDTAGNVFEWVADCWHDSFSNAPLDGSALEKEGCSKRVIRGGAWSFPAKEIRSSNRWRDFSARRSDDTGFRIARDL